MKLKKFYRCLYRTYKTSYNYIHIYDEEFTIYNGIITQKLNDKPSGFWISYPNIDNSWTGLCIRIFPDRIDPDLNTIYGVDIDTKKVLHINTIKKLESFHKEYSIQVSTFLLNHKIKWDVLTEKWSGIFIEYMYPYLDQFRYPVHQEILSWYGTWDCESGCIWNIDAIKKINVLYKKI